ncbi:MAG TPA: HAMP domain-containing protein [Thermodesulfobacteriota bacterium]|nr:HAMP domain-containing protein [Thermodesulfobacteriota bacterium]
MAVEKRDGLGLLPKLLIGTLIPIFVAFLIIGVIVFFSVDLGKFRMTSVKDIGSESLKELTSASLNESKSSLGQMGERMIKEKAIDVAAEIELFIKTHPKVKREELLRDPWLKSIAVQKVGETGYTAVHDNMGINYFHVNPQIVGSDLHDLSTELPAFWKILEASLKGPAYGYYDWKDADGRIRPKYMYLAHVKDTDLIVAATTYIDEFSRPTKTIEGRMSQIEKSSLEGYEGKIKIFYVVILCVVLVLLIRIYFYARSLIRPIRHLSEVADKISMGQWDTPIQIKEKGEVGALAESIERMQIAVKAAIERLQKRTEGG